MWFNKRDYVLVVVILVKFYLGFKVIGIKTFVFNPKNIEEYGERNRECLEYTLGHAFEWSRGRTIRCSLALFLVSKLGQWLKVLAFMVSPSL
jgi:hypothetical protein